jgi:hypothetical protein
MVYSYPGYTYTTESIFLRIRMKQFYCMIIKDLIPCSLIRPLRKSDKDKNPNFGLGDTSRILFVYTKIH